MKPDQQPKYLNTSDGEIFHKGQIVYGQDMARAAAAKAGRVVIVEGYTDVIALHQAGVPETVAQMGTALTEQQVDAIARLAPKALFCQDPDSAGQESAQRGLEALTALMKSDKWRTRAVEFKIVRLPSKQDPADVVQDAGRGRDARAARDGDADRALRGRARAGASRAPSTDEMLAEAVADHRSAAGQRAARRARQAHRRPARAQRAARQRGAARRGARAGGARDRWDGRGDGVERPRRAPVAAAAAASGRERSATASAPPAPPPEPVDPRAALARRERERGGVPRLLPRAARGGRAAARRGRRSTTTSPRPRPARPPTYLRGRLRTPAADLPSGRRGRSPAWSPSSSVRRRRARGHAGQARARGAAARPAPARAPHLAAPASPGATRRQRPRRRAPAGARRDPPSADLSRTFRPTHELVFVSSWTATALAAQLAEGRSIESIARETGRAASTVALLGQQARPDARRTRPPRRRAAGSSASELEALLAEGLSIRAMAERLGVSLHDRPALAGAARARDAARRGGSPRRLRRARAGAETTEANCPVHGRHDVRPARRRRIPLPAAAAAARCTAAGARSSGSWWRRRAARACSAATTARSPALHFHHLDPATKSFALVAPGRHALAGRGAGRSGEMRAALLELPCRGRGRDCATARRRYYYEARPHRGRRFGGSSIGRAFGC